MIFSEVLKACQFTEYGVKIIAFLLLHYKAGHKKILVKPYIDRQSFLTVEPAYVCLYDCVCVRERKSVYVCVCKCVGIQSYGCICALFIAKVQ